MVDYRLKTEREGEHPIFNDPRVCEALEEAVVSRGCSVLIRLQENGRILVEISYGDLERDAAVQFDCAEFGVGENLLQAIRYALGAHYGSPEEVYA